MRLLFLFVATFGLAACGPDLNSPASKSVAGRWQSPDSVSFFYNVNLNLDQSQQGDITGNWNSRIRGGNLGCPETVQSCAAANTVAGRNTVVGVSMEILGIGKFTGQLEGDSLLKGDIYRYDGDFKVKFTKIK